MQKIQQISRRFRIFFQTLFWILPIKNILLWSNFNTIFSVTPAAYWIDTHVGPNQFSMPLPTSILWLACLISMMSTSIVMLGIHYLIKLFRLYEKGQIFNSENVSYLRKLGYMFFAWVFIRIPEGIVMSFVLTWHNVPPAKHMVGVSFASPDCTALITGALIILLSWIMAEGYKLQEEQTYTV